MAVHYSQRQCQNKRSGEVSSDTNRDCHPARVPSSGNLIQKKPASRSPASSGQLVIVNPKPLVTLRRFTSQSLVPQYSSVAATQPEPQTQIILDEPKVFTTQRQIIQELRSMNQQQRLHYVRDKKAVRSFHSEHNYSLAVDLLEGFIVRKRLSYTQLGYELFMNEVRALMALNGHPHFPVLLSYDIRNLVIYMTYCGEPITAKTLPSDWKQQAEEIYQSMKQTGTNSNDY